MTKEEKAIRGEAERKLKGKGDKLTPPRYLCREQKGIFKSVVKELSASELLGNVDVYILSAFAIAISRLREIEQRINEEPELLRDRALMSSKDKYTKDLYRCCNELCLSPQSRAKIGAAAMTAAKGSENPLLEILKGNGD